MLVQNLPPAVHIHDAWPFGKLMSLQVSLPDHVFIINKISLFTSNLRREKQNEPQMPAIVYFLFFVGIFCYFGIQSQKELVQTLTLILKQIIGLTDRAQPDYVRNGAFENRKEKKTGDRTN
jgi:hypothetical protein